MSERFWRACVRIVENIRLIAPFIKNRRELYKIAKDLAELYAKRYGGSAEACMEYLRSHGYVPPPPPKKLVWDGRTLKWVETYDE